MEDLQKLENGDYLHDDGGEFRVLANVDGYLMMRRLGCVPFVAAWDDVNDHACFKGFGDLRLGRSTRTKPLAVRPDKDTPK